MILDTTPLYNILKTFDTTIPTIPSITRDNAEFAFNAHFRGQSTEIADYVIVKCNNDYYIIWLNGPPTDDNQYTGIKDGIIKVNLASNNESNNKNHTYGGSRRSRYSKKSKRSKRSKQTRRSKK